MRDGRLIRSGKKTPSKCKSKHRSGILMMPLGDRDRVTVVNNTIEERMSIEYYDKFLRAT